ncbi:MAG: tol-pal system-associated acyl-CoA thioesterase [Vibrio sp.]
MNIFEWPVRIYYEDTDAGGVVYHANYLRFFERARTEFLRDAGMNQQSFLEQGTGFVVRHMDIDFIRAARLDDQLIVKSWVINMKRASMDFCQELVNPDGNVLCKTIVKVAYIDNVNMKPIAMPSTLTTELISSEC